MIMAFCLIEFGESLCQIWSLEYFWDAPSVILTPLYARLSLSSGFFFFFRATNQQGHIVDRPLVISKAESRLKNYLRDAQLDNGETLHSIRSGCSLTLDLLGSSLVEVMAHVSWLDELKSCVVLP